MVLTKEHKDILIEFVNQKLSININQLNTKMVIRDMSSLVSIEYKEDIERLSKNIKILNDIKKELDLIIC